MDTGQFRDKKYWGLILGASSGMGWAAAERLAKAGMNLCLVHRDRRSALVEIDKKFESLYALGIQIKAYNMDALKAENRSLILDALSLIRQEGGSLRLLLHSIAKGNLKGLVDATAPLSEDDLRLTTHAMGSSLWEWTQDALSRSLFANDARIIGLSSEGSRRAWPGYAAVSVAKAALEALIRAMAAELAPLGIRANIVQAGITDTPALRMIPGYEKLIEQAQLRNPFGRLTRPEDVAQVIYLLCLDESAWINGAIIPVDGGESIR